MRKLVTETSQKPNAILKEHKNIQISQLIFMSCFIKKLRNMIRFYYSGKKEEELK